MSAVYESNANTWAQSAWLVGGHHFCTLCFAGLSFSVLCRAGGTTWVFWGWGKVFLMCVIHAGLYIKFICGCYSVGFHTLTWAVVTFWFRRILFYLFVYCKTFWLDIVWWRGPQAKVCSELVQIATAMTDVHTAQASTWAVHLWHPQLLYTLNLGLTFRIMHYHLLHFFPVYKLVRTVL